MFNLLKITAQLFTVRSKRVEFLHLKANLNCLVYKPLQKRVYTHINTLINIALLLIAFTWLPFTATCQPGHLKFTSLTSRDGLLSNSVNAILKDSRGLMWFATDDGLNKFDGTNFTVYRYSQGDTTSLRECDILTLHE